jgi:penicillin-binding protein 2B
MAQADNQRLLVYVAVEKPKLAQHENGAVPVSGVFNSVMKRSLQYLSIQPDGRKKPNTKKKEEVGVDDPDLVGKSLGEVADNEGRGPSYVVVGEGSKVIKQIPQAGQDVIEGEKVLLLTEESPSLPDLTGLSLRDVRKLTNLLGIKSNIIGNGYVHKQSIIPGTQMKSGDHLIVELKSNRPLPDTDVQDEDSEEEEDVS